MFPIWRVSNTCGVKVTETRVMMTRQSLCRGGREDHHRRECCGIPDDFYVGLQGVLGYIVQARDGAMRGGDLDCRHTQVGITEVDECAACCWNNSEGTTDCFQVRSVLEGQLPLRTACKKGRQITATDASSVTGASAAR